MAYISTTDLKTYLGISGSGDDALLAQLNNAASARIDSFTGRTFWAGADTTKYFDPSRDIIGGILYLDADLSYLTSVTDGNSVSLTADIYHNPRNTTPWYALGLVSSSNLSWDYDDDVQNSITVIGRWAHMQQVAITALSRSTNVVTATCDPGVLSVGAAVSVVGCADATFNGNFTITATTTTSVTWAQTASNDTDTTATMLITPPDIVQAARRLAVWLYRQKDTQQGDADRPLLAGDGTIIMPTTLPQDVAQILTPYRRLI